nr:hypothetical protein [Mucilaginibacter glaciei]
MDHTDKDNCCKNDVKSFKVKDTHVGSVSFALNDISAAILPVDHSWTSITIVSEQIGLVRYQAHAPPGDAATPIYTLNCNYRI